MAYIVTQKILYSYPPIFKWEKLNGIKSYTYTLELSPQCIHKGGNSMLIAHYCLINIGW